MRRAVIVAAAVVASCGANVLLAPQVTEAALPGVSETQAAYRNLRTGVFFLHQVEVSVDLQEQMNRAKEQLYLEEDPQMAEATLDQVIRLNDQITEAYYLRAQAKAAQENYYAADKDYESALMLEPENPCLYNVRGQNVLYQYEKDGYPSVSRARNYFEKAISYAPNNIDALVGIAESYYLQHDYETALQKYNEMLVLFPDNDYLKTRKEDCRQQLARKAEQERRYELRRKINA